MRKKFVVWCFCLFLAGSLGILFVHAQNDSKPKLAPANPAFLRAIENMQSGRFSQEKGLGYIPGPIDFSYYKGVYSKRVRAAYPTSYDLRTYNKVTPVKDQGGCGSCWAFGAYGSLESWIKPTETRDFSELHLIRYHGFDWTECEGGNTSISEAYLARWGGPYNESDYPYPYTVSGDAGNSATVQKHVQTVIWLPGRTSSTDNDTIKWFIMNYGAVTFAFYYDATYVHSTYKTYYCPLGIDTNHEVCIVGWDDNFDKNKFKNVPPGNGAFLCKNSWGTTHWSTNNGYFWLSYYDPNITDLCSFIDAQSPKNYTHIYQYDPLGLVYGFGYGTTTGWGANVFTASTNDPLRAISFIISDKCTVTYYIYKNPTSGNPTSGLLVSSGTIGTLSYAGYYTYNLPTVINLVPGDKFSVVIKYVNNNYTYPIPMEGYSPGYTSGATNAAGQSYFSSNGTSWSDAYNYSGNSYKFNCTIKAFTGYGGVKDDFLGTWDGQGVYYRNSDTGTWTKMASPANLIAVGDLDGDAIDDLIGIWPGQGGVWVKYSKTGSWAKLSSTAKHIAAGDMNGDGRSDLLGTYDGQGVYYRNSLNGTWVKLASPANLITAGDLDGDAKDDLIGIWPTQGGVWVKYSKTGAWSKLSSTAKDIAAGDTNGDGRDDLLATYDGQGVYYRNSMNGAWVKMANPADQVTCGDLDGDGTEDLIGIWPAQGGVWVKYSKTGGWEKLSSTARDIAAGKMRAGGATSLLRFMELPAPIGGYVEGPESLVSYQDLSSEGPGGLNFLFQEEKNIVPQEQGYVLRIPGPGEPGFRWIEQKNLFPQEGINNKHGKKKK